MDTFSNQAFWTEFEKNRLNFEDHVLHLPESSYILTQFGKTLNIDVAAYLHAVPIAASMFRICFYSPRTAEQISSRLSPIVSCPFDPNHIGYVLTCFAFAHLYRKAYKASDSAEFARQFSTILCLSSFNYGALQHVDWAVKAFAESRKPGQNNWLAPAFLFSVWVTRIESEPAARAIIGFLEKVSAYADEVWHAALKNQVYMVFPW